MLLLLPTIKRIGYALDSEQLSTLQTMIQRASEDADYFQDGDCAGWAVQFPALLGFPVPEFTSGFVPNPTELWYSIDTMQRAAGTTRPVYVRP